MVRVRSAGGPTLVWFCKINSMLRIRVLELRIPICAAGGGMGVWMVMCNQLANRTGDAHVGRQQLQHLADSAYTHNTRKSLRPRRKTSRRHFESAFRLPRGVLRVCLFSSPSFISLVRNAQLCFRISKR